MSIKLSDIVVFVLFSIPLVGAMNISICKVIQLRRSKKEESKLKMIIKIGFLAVFIIITLALFAFAIVFCFFHKYELPFYIKLFGCIGLLFYYGIIASITTGLSDVVFSGYSSGTKVLNKLLEEFKDKNKNPRE